MTKDDLMPQLRTFLDDWYGDGTNRTQVGAADLLL